MRTIKYFLVLPFALSAMTSCGGKFSKISYNEAAKIAKNYADSISTNKASDIVMSGHVNKIHMKGDATYWSYQPQGFEDEELFSYIPNFSFENAEVKVDEHDMAKATLPSSLTSLVSKLTEGMKKKYGLIFVVLGNLPKFPMNPNLLKVLYGVDPDTIRKDEDGNIMWGAVKEKEWEYGDVKFYKDGAKLKVTMDTDDAVMLLDEISSCFKEKHIKLDKVTASAEKEERKIPLSLALTTNKIGYIDSLSVKTKVENIDLELPKDDTEMFYFHIKGDLEIDLILKFKQEFSDPFTIKYQLNVYKEAKGGVIPDVIYNDGEVDMPLTLSESIAPTTSLENLSQYVAFNWYSNVEKTEGKKGAKTAYPYIGKTYDDPIFRNNYWKKSPNVAFTNDSYDALVIPTYDKVTYAPKYSILGAYPPEGDSPVNRSLINTSIDGKVVSSDTGLPSSDGEKILEASADSLQKICLSKETTLTQEPLIMDEIFINSNLLNSKKSEYIVSLSVLDLEGK